MTKPGKKIIAGFSGYKAVIAIGCGIALSLAILTFSNRVTTPNKNNPYFNYGAKDNRNGLIQVADDQRVEVPFVFDISQGISEVSLEFFGEHTQVSGIVLTDNTAVVVNGKVTSRVVIQFDSKPALKAGTHFLTLVARDTVTGKIVRKGEIQFTYNMHEVISKCSC
jgi:hypothetical protein